MAVARATEHETQAGSKPKGLEQKLKSHKLAEHVTLQLGIAEIKVSSKIHIQRQRNTNAMLRSNYFIRFLPRRN